MASITISGGGSIPERSKTFTSDATPEGHKRLFEEMEIFTADWQAATEEQDRLAQESTS